MLDGHASRCNRPTTFFVPANNTLLDKYLERDVASPVLHTPSGLVVRLQLNRSAYDGKDALTAALFIFVPKTGDDDAPTATTKAPIHSRIMQATKIIRAHSKDR
ncbi:unnamed protein product [Peniophora sp. CBMAI 1063]|nr:unnamed protein product [Peniophora sp. CBMAI 1063]